MIFKNKNSEYYELDYNTYDMSLKEKIAIVTISAIVLALIGFIFYRNRIMMIVLMSLFSLFAPKYIEKKKIKNQKRKINSQFKDALYALASSLSSGKSIENAMEDIVKDLLIQYHPKERIVIEFQLIHKKISYNTSVYDAILNFADRSHCEDIQNFASVLEVTKASGGETNKIIKRTARMITEKFEVKEDINLLVEGKKSEMRGLIFMPIFLVLMLSITAKEYMAPVFVTQMGLIGTTVSIILIVIGQLIANKILDMEV